MLSVALRNRQTVEEAAAMARQLADDEARRSGTPITTAVRTLARRLAVAPGRIWCLLYRPPAEVGAGLYLELQDMVRQGAVREIERLEHELAAARAAGGSGRDVEIREIEAAARALRQKLGQKPDGGRG